MTVLKYPQELNQGQVDYVTFKSEEYRTNRDIAGGNVGPNAGPPSQGASIVLYMPSTTPAVTQRSDWGAKTFDGPLGAIMGNLAAGATNEMLNADISNFEAGKATGKRIVDQVKNQFESSMGSGGAAVKQAGVNVIAGMAGMKPNQLVAMQRGEIFNPNVELLYNGPKLRGFSMSFTFVPKSPAEAQIINNIILEFKKWSAPEDLESGMFKVPHVWQVNYMSGSGVNKNMNAFKKAALTDVAVQNNQGMNMHMSFDDGMPIITTLSLNFTEVDIITRNDHLSSGTNVGY